MAIQTGQGRGQQVQMNIMARNFEALSTNLETTVKRTFEFSLEASENIVLSFL